MLRTAWELQARLWTQLVSQLSAQVSTSAIGGVYIDNTGDVTITEVDGLAGITTQGGDVVVTAASSITVDEPIISAGGDVTQTATEDITVNAPIITGGGNFTATADSDLNGSGTFTGTGGAPALPAGAVLHYAMDATPAGNGATIVDSSGSGNTGTWNTNDANSSVAGRFGNALQFDDDLNDYVIANPVVAWPTTEFTLSTWVNTTTTGTESILSYFVPGSNNEFLLSRPDALRLWIGTVPIDTSISIADGNWHHLAITWASAGGALEFFVDGQSQFTGTLNAGHSLVAGGAFVIGQDQDSAGGGFELGEGFDGQIDETSVFNRVLTPVEVAALARNVVSSGSGNINVTASDVALGGSLFATGGGDIDINADTMEISDAMIQGSGNLSILPRTAGTSIGLGGGAGTLSLTQAELDTLADGFNSITINGELPESISEDFTLEGIPASLQANGATGNITDDNGHLQFGGVGNGSRSFVRTVAGDFFSKDFVAEVTVTVPAAGANSVLAFFGMGEGTPNPATSYEPINPGIHTRLHNDLNFGLLHASDNGVSTAFNTGSDPGSGTHRIRLTWDAATQQARLQVDTDFTGGTFTADQDSGLIDGSDNGFNDTNTHIYFGGNENLIYDDFSVTSTVRSAVTVGSSAFQDDVTIIGGDITVTGALSNQANENTTLLSPAAGTITVDSSITGVGTGAVSLTTAREIVLNSGSSITTVDGDVTLSANRQASPSTGDFVGIDVAGPITTSGSGVISLSGRGGDSAQDHGVRIALSVNVTSTGTGVAAGSINIDGESVAAGGDGIHFENGMLLESIDGDIILTGVSSGASGILGNGGLIRSTGTGTNASSITVVGQTTAASVHSGVRLSGTSIRSVDGNIDIDANGNGTAGLLINGSSQIESTGTTADAAKIDVVGTGSVNNGVVIQQNNLITSVVGDISITGNGSGIVNDFGILLSGNSLISSTGTGTTAADIILIGNNPGDGVGLISAGQRVTSLDGEISITGNSTNDDGIEIRNDAEVVATGFGNVLLTGNSTGGSADDVGLLISDGIVSAATGQVSLASTDDISVATLSSLSSDGGFDVTVGDASEIAAALSGAGGFQYVGDDILTVSGTNTYTGPTTVSTGTLRLGASNVLHNSGLVDVASGATFDLNDFDEQVLLVKGDGNVTLGSGDLTVAFFGLDIYSGSISGTGDVTKASGGTWILNGVHTYTGATTVNGGALVVNGSLPGTVDVGNGAELRGLGTTGEVTVASGGTVAPGNSPGVLTVGTFDLQPGSTLEIELGGTNPTNNPVVYDQVNVTGTGADSVKLAGTLDVVNFDGFTPTSGDTLYDHRQRR